MQTNFKLRTIVLTSFLFYSRITTLYTCLFHLVFFVIFKLPSTILTDFGYMSIDLSCSLRLFPLLWLLHCTPFFPKTFLNFQVYLDYLIHSRIKSKLNQYAFTISALDPRVYMFAYDFDLHSVLVPIQAYVTVLQYTTLHRILHKCIDTELCQS